MILSRKNYSLVLGIIFSWEKEGIITSGEAEKLRASLVREFFDWKKLAFYSFITAAICLAVAVSAVFLDEKIIGLIMRLLQLPFYVWAVLFALVSSFFYYLGFRFRDKNTARRFSSEFMLFTGAVFTPAAIYLAGEAFRIPDERFPLLVLALSAVYLAIGAAYPSAITWLAGLISFCTWFGAETGYISGWGAYFLGMNYPLRFMLLGIALVFFSFLMPRIRLRELRKTTYIVGLLDIFIPLWLMSVFGNFGSGSTLLLAGEDAELFFWSVLFALASVLSVVYGLKKDDAASRGFGITFFLINVYTRYFEYFWNTMHKALFFALLASSFWVLGRYAEKAWLRLKDKFMEDHS